MWENGGRDTSGQYDRFDSFNAAAAGCVAKYVHDTRAQRARTTLQSHLIIYVLTHTRSLHPCSSCRYEQFLQKRNPGAQNITYDVGDFNKWLDKQEVGMIA